MMFRVGPWGYKVVILRGLSDKQGEPLMGRCDYDGHRIYLDAELQPESRKAVLLHELRHAWTYHVGYPNDEEGECDLTATIAESYASDLARQGGFRVLAAMRPEGEPDEPPPVRELRFVSEEEEAAAPPPEFREPHRTYPVGQVQPVEHNGPSRGGRAQCGRCDLIVSDGSVVTGKIKYDSQAKGRVVSRVLYCPHCHHLQSWDEGANSNGHPNGAVVRGPVYQRGEVVENFLIDNPDAAGMVAN